VSSPAAKYSAGDRVIVKIGDRPEIAFKVLAVTHREKPYYQFDWEEHGYAAQLNTVNIPETTIIRAAI
jgi:hypothetical protein